MGKEGNPRKQGIGRGGKIVNVVAETTQPLYEILGVFFKKSLAQTNRNYGMQCKAKKIFISNVTTRRES